MHFETWQLTSWNLWKDSPELWQWQVWACRDKFFNYFFDVSNLQGHTCSPEYRQSNPLMKFVCEPGLVKCRRWQLQNVVLKLCKYEKNQLRRPQIISCLQQKSGYLQFWWTCGRNTFSIGGDFLGSRQIRWSPTASWISSSQGLSNSPQADSEKIFDTHSRKTLCWLKIEERWACGLRFQSNTNSFGTPHLYCFRSPEGLGLRFVRLACLVTTWLSTCHAETTVVGKSEWSSLIYERRSVAYHARRNCVCARVHWLVWK